MSSKPITAAFVTLCISCIVSLGCASTPRAEPRTETATGLSLNEAIERAAKRIAEDVGNLADRIARAAEKRRIAVVAFESESDALSDFIMSELSGALFDRNIEIVERQGLNWVMKELDFQMSGAVSDDTIQALGQFMGAELIVTGQLRHLGGNYRLTANAIRVEQATRASIPRFDVRNDRAMQNMVAAINNQTLKTRAAYYGVTVNTKPQSAGTFLDRGIQFAMRSEFEKAITDFTEALRLNPNLVGAYILRGKAYVGSISRVYDLAIADYTTAIRLDPNDALAYNNRGNAYRDKRDLNSAIADYTTAIRLDPNLGPAYNNRGIAYRDKGDLDRAIADFETVLRIDPQNTNARQSLEQARQARGR